MEEPKPQQRYMHFKGKEYEVIVVAKDCEDPSKRIVVYKQLYGTPENPVGTIWVRSLDDFVGDKVFQEDTAIGERRFRAGERVKRFTLIE